jgi:hypothetical protein
MRIRENRRVTWLLTTPRNADGAIAFQAIMRSLIRHPKQVPTLFRLALDSWAARQALVPSRRFLGPNLGLPDMRQHLLDVA